ncbi:MAG: response regulator transcription factor [Chitinophagaceae bacterium]|nr:response regulator transcription factor [Chitinophagaceae bacterium]
MAENITALIVDDEFQSRKLITKMLSQFFSEIKDITEASTVDEAKKAIDAALPQLIFLDIQKHGENGFDLLEKLTDFNFEIIFITAHNQYAVKAFRYNALDYLMKPVDTDEFKTAVLKAIKRIKQIRIHPPEQIGLLKQQLKNSQGLPDRIIIPTAEGYLIIPVQDISYCHANSNYTVFYLKDKTKVTSSYTMGHYEDILSEHNFFRIHRSYMINLGYIKMYKKGEGGIVVMNDGQEIEVSRGNKEAFMKFFKG